MRSGLRPVRREIVERHLVDREEAARRAVLGRHVPERRPVGERQRRDALAEVLDELPDDAGLAQDLGHGQHQVGRGRSLGQRAAEPEADDLRHEHRERLAEHRGLRLDSSGAPAEDAEPVDHRRVRVGPDERVGERDAVTVLDHAREVLEVDLVADARSGRNDLEAAQRLLAPAQEEVALVVALELELDVAAERAARGERVHLDRVVDHELGRDQRIDLLRIAAEIGHRVRAWRRGRRRQARRSGPAAGRATARTRSRVTARPSHPSAPPPRRPPRRRCAARSRAAPGACRAGARCRRRPAAHRAGRSRTNGLRLAAGTARPLPRLKQTRESGRPGKLAVWRWSGTSSASAAGATHRSRPVCSTTTSSA